VKRVLALLFAVLTVAAFAAHAADSTKINGWISDSMCGAKHAGSGAACVKKCIEGGMTPVFVDEDKKAVWTIDNPDAVKSFYGAHVTVTATADDAKKSVHIDSIADAK
jgi:predicted ABC-class ATPase